MSNSKLEEKISTAFHGGEVLRREVRLAPGEAAYAAAHWNAEVVPLGGDWYEITFMGSVRHAG